MKEETKRFEGLGTKIDSAMAEVLDACCNALGVDVYHLLQWFAYTIIRASAPMHELDPRIQKLMTLMESIQPGQPRPAEGVARGAHLGAARAQGLWRGYD